MASLRKIARREGDLIREGIAWLVVWKSGRSWDAEAFWLNTETDGFEPEDEPRVREISLADPHAVMLNGYYCGHLGEDMNAEEIADGILWHYDNGCNKLAANL